MISIDIMQDFSISILFIFYAGPDASSTIYDFRRSDNRPLPRGYRIENGVLYLTNVDQSASGEYACVGSDRISGRILFTIYATFEVIGKWA